MTIKEIAELAGVSTSTVSKIVNNKDENIHPDTRNRVLKVVKEYNYSPYASVKSTSEAKTFLLGVLLRDARHAGRLLGGIMAAAHQKGYGILAYDSMDCPEDELKNISALCRCRVDGVIWEPVSEQSLESERYFSAQHIAVCLMNCSAAPSYSIDFQSMGYAAAEHLIRYGHHKLACLVREGSRLSDLVYEGFCQCLYDCRIPYVENMRLVDGKNDWSPGLLSHVPTGVVSSHYASALALLEQVRRIGHRVPYDLSLISLRESSGEEGSISSISSIRVPYEEFGRFLCEQLVAKCEKSGQTAEIFQTDCPLENTSSLDVPISSFSKRIVVVGSINIDVTLNVDELPQPGKTVSTDKHSVSPGGKGANQAVGAARLGAQVALIGKVGDDYDAALVYGCMEDSHVDIRGIGRDPAAETGKAFIHLQNDGESMITILTGANHSLGPEDIELHPELFHNAGYCLLQTEVPENAILAAAVAARAQGAKNILKPAAMHRISDSLMKQIDIFVPNRKEAQILCPDGKTLREKADYFLGKGVGTVVITLGHSGCYVRSADYEQSFPAADFTAVDTTGAADAFIAALAVYLLSGYSLDHSIRIAAFAAGFCVSRQGVIPALIDRSSLEAYIRQTEPALL